MLQGRLHVQMSTKQEPELLSGTLGDLVWVWHKNTTGVGNIYVHRLAGQKQVRAMLMNQDKGGSALSTRQTEGKDYRRGVVY